MKVFHVQSPKLWCPVKGSLSKGVLPEFPLLFSRFFSLCSLSAFADDNKRSTVRMSE